MSPGAEPIDVSAVPSAMTAAPDARCAASSPRVFAVAAALDFLTDFLRGFFAAVTGWGGMWWAAAAQGMVARPGFPPTPRWHVMQSTLGDRGLIFGM